eukprot:7387809-Prymnesium_polylepis.1
MGQNLSRYMPLGEEPAAARSSRRGSSPPAVIRATSGKRPDWLKGPMVDDAAARKAAAKIL